MLCPWCKLTIFSFVLLLVEASVWMGRGRRVFVRCFVRWFGHCHGESTQLFRYIFKAFSCTRGSHPADSAADSTPAGNGHYFLLPSRICVAPCHVRCSCLFCYLTCFVGCVTLGCWRDSICLYSHTRDTLLDNLHHALPLFVQPGRMRDAGATACMFICNSDDSQVLLCFTPFTLPR